MDNSSYANADKTKRETTEIYSSSTTILNQSIASVNNNAIKILYGNKFLSSNSAVGHLHSI